MNPVDHAAAERFWASYVEARPTLARLDDEHPAERFGDSPEMADELLTLVLDGTKRATAALVVEFAEEGEPLPRIGGHWIACDGSGAPRAVLRTTGLALARFSDVDEQFAHDEGEGDRTLADWREGHRRYWTRTRAARGTTFDEQRDEIVLERFTVAWPPEAAMLGP